MVGLLPLPWWLASGKDTALLAVELEVRDVSVLGGEHKSAKGNGAAEDAGLGTGRSNGKPGGG
jgi:hypothetical protein